MSISNNQHFVYNKISSSVTVIILRITSSFSLFVLSHISIRYYFHSFEHALGGFTSYYVRFSLFRATSELNYSIRLEQQLSKGSRRTNRSCSGRIIRVARISASFSRSSVINSKLIGNVNTTRHTYIIGSQCVTPLVYSRYSIALHSSALLAALIKPRRVYSVQTSSILDINWNNCNREIRLLVEILTFSDNSSNK